MVSSVRILALCLLIIFLLAMTLPSTGLRILGVFPVGVKSHFIMGETLMRGLAERGHQVDVYSQFPLKKSLPNYTDYKLEIANAISTNNVSYDVIKSHISNSIPPMMDLGNRLCDFLELPIFQKLIKSLQNNPPYDLIVIEHFSSHCYLALGRYSNIPMIAVVTTTLMDWTNEALGNPSNPILYPSLFSRNIDSSTFIERLENVLLNIYVGYTFRYYVSSQNKYIEKYFGTGFPDVSELEKDVSLVLINHHPVLHGIRPFTPAIIPVGGLHIVDYNDTLKLKIKKFLDESKYGFILFTFGSMVRIETFPEPILDALYKTFKNIAPVRVLMKIAKPEELPPGLPSNVFTDSWLPQIQVLKHKNIKAFITHGGLMGTQESIYYGVPMIGIPLFGDQYYNIELYVKKNIAIKLMLSEITEEILTNALNKILKNSSYKKNVEKMSSAFRDVPMDTMSTAAFWIEYIARHGKDALRSPIIDMSWWQASLMDVYSFIAVNLLLVLYVLLVIVKFVIKKLIGIISSKPTHKLITTKTKKLN